MGRLDPRWRLAGLFATLFAAAFVRSLAAASLALAGCLLLALLAGMDWRWYRAGLLIIVFVLLLFVAPFPLLAEVETGEGLRLAGLFLVKGLALYTLSTVLLVSAPLETTLKAARALLVPGLLVQLALLTYRYLFVLAEELARLRIALRVRGFRNRPNWHSYHTVSAAIGTLLVRGHDRAERVAAAMRCRGFTGQFRSLSPWHTHGVDVFVCLAMLAAATALVCLDISLLPR